MRTGFLLGKLLPACLLLAAASSQAGVLHARAEVLRSELATLESLELRLEWPEGAAEGALELRAARLDFPLMGYRARDLAWRCPLQRDPAGGWRCRGGLTVAGGAPAQLDVAISPAANRAELALGDKSISYEALAGSPELTRLVLEQIPAAWLQAFLGSLWSQGQWTRGAISGELRVRTPPDGAVQVDAKLDLKRLSLETPDGALAAADVDAGLELEYRARSGSTQIDATLTTRRGEFLAGSFYALLPNSPVKLQVRARQAGTGPWQLPQLSVHDGAVLRADGHAALDADGALRDLELSLSLGDLGVARDRYLSGFLAPAGYADLILSGAARATLSMREGEWRQLALAMDQATAVDPRQRFILAGLQGDLRWDATGVPVTSAFTWRDAALFGIGLESTRLRWRSGDGELTLAQAARVGVLGGSLALQNLRWRPPTGERGARFELGAELEGLSLASLSQRLGWPPFKGTLSGSIPAARYADGILRLDGGLQMRLFDGRIGLDDLVMERPFGVAPTLSGNVSIRGIDLVPMTEAFGFGSITGRLDGHINGLRMVDWSPVAFDARLQTDPDWPGRRRISQRAVQDISKVGGAGLAADLQTRVLKAFDDFGYREIGLACRLRDNVCQMDGVGSAGEGYIIVQGAGLPRIQVVGFRRQVDWPTLVARLEAASQGQAPIIQ
jgi:hypothetical protein